MYLCGSGTSWGAGYSEATGPFPLVGFPHLLQHSPFASLPFLGPRSERLGCSVCLRHCVCCMDCPRLNAPPPWQLELPLRVCHFCPFSCALRPLFFHHIQALQLFSVKGREAVGTGLVYHNQKPLYFFLIFKNQSFLPSFL